MFLRLCRWPIPEPATGRAHRARTSIRLHACSDSARTRGRAGPECNPAQELQGTVQEGTLGRAVLSRMTAHTGG